jgi:hypothetical protein
MALDLPYLNGIGQRSAAKGQPHVLAKEAKRKTKAQQHKAFRDAVWERDGGKSRASGKPLVKSGTTDWKKLGEVHHVKARSTDPAMIFYPGNGILLSKDEHALAETWCPKIAGHRLLEIEGPEDRSRPQLFIWRDIYGKQLKKRMG